MTVLIFQNIDLEVLNPQELPSTERCLSFLICLKLPASLSLHRPGAMTLKHSQAMFQEIWLSHKKLPPEPVVADVPDHYLSTLRRLKLLASPLNSRSSCCNDTKISEASSKST